MWFIKNKKSQTNLIEWLLKIAMKDVCIPLYTKKNSKVYYLILRMKLNYFSLLGLELYKKTY